MLVRDTNAVLDNPRCNGLAWKILALGAEQWGITLGIPKAVIVEAVTGGGQKGPGLDPVNAATAFTQLACPVIRRRAVLRCGPGSFCPWPR